MTQNQPISAERAADLLAALVPAVARVELYPQWSDGTGEAVRRTRAIPYDAAGDIIELLTVERRFVAGLLRRLDGAVIDLDRPQTLDVAARTVTPVFSVAPSLPVALWESPVAADPYRAAQLDVQRHELEDAVVPPLAVDPDFAASVAARFVEPVDWGDAPAEAPAREVTDVPVQGGAL